MFGFYYDSKNLEQNQQNMQCLLDIFSKTVLVYLDSMSTNNAIFRQQRGCFFPFLKGFEGVIGETLRDHRRCAHPKGVTFSLCENIRRARLRRGQRTYPQSATYTPSTHFPRVIPSGATEPRFSAKPRYRRSRLAVNKKPRARCEHAELFCA